MTLAAAIIPYGAGYSAVLVASGDALPMTYVHAESFPVGRLVQLEEAVGGKTMKRELDDASLATLCQQIHASLHGATRALIVTSQAAVAARIVSALSEFLPTCGVEVQLVGQTGGFVANAFHGWNPPEHGQLIFERCAGALIAAKGGWKRDIGREGSDSSGNGDAPIVQVGAGNSRQPRVERPMVCLLETQILGGDEVPEDGCHDDAVSDGTRYANESVRGVSSLRGRNEGVVLAGRDRVADERLVSGPVTAALDPGSSYLGVAIVQHDPLSSAAPIGQIHLLLAQTFDVGETVIEGSKSRHVLNDASLDALCDRVVRLLVEFGVTQVSLEHVDSVHIAPTQLSAASSIGTALIRTMMVGTTLRERLRVAGIPVTRVRAATWRARIGTRGKRGDSEIVALPDVLASRIVNWQEWAGDVDEHGRDACGIAIFGTMPAIESRPSSNMARKSGKVDTAQEKRNKIARGVEQKRILRQKQREAKGCRCVITNEDRAHKDGCPIRAEQKAKMALPRGQYKKTREREAL